SFFHLELGFWKAFGLWVGGMAFWSFTEYMLHRFVFHYHPKSKIGQRIHFIAHGVHHDYPNDSLRLVLPPSISVPLAFLFFGIFYAILGFNYTIPFYGGFVM